MSMTAKETLPGDIWGGLGDPADPIPQAEDMRRGTLPSGLEYFIVEEGFDATINLVVKAGSLHEEEHERGFAHFVEHMAFVF